MDNKSPRNYSERQTYMEKVIDSLPEEIETLLEDAEGYNTGGSIGEKGVTDKELAYHMLPDEDRGLGETYTAKEVADQFDIAKGTARGRLDKLETQGIVYEDEREGHLFTISPALRKRIDAFESQGIRLDETDVATDGGVSRIERSLSNETTKLDNTLSQQLSTPNSSRLRDEVMDGVMIPIAVLISFFTIYPIASGSGSLLVAVLIIGVVWMLSKLAEVPEHMPQETARRFGLEIRPEI